VTTYIIRRLIQTVFLIFLLSIIFFLLVRAGGQVSNCGTFGCELQQHLDQPITTQYLYFVGNLFHGNFGIESGGTPVATEILQKLPPTILLVTVSFVFQQLIALPLGVLAALRPYTLFDGILTFISYVFLSIPAFFLALLLIYLFPVHFGWFSVAHYESPLVPPIGTGDWFSALGSDPGFVLGDLAQHLVLPVFVLTATGIAIDSRFMRAAMLQVLHQEYIRTAHAKGLPRRTVLFKHAFRNALLPIVTNIGLYLPALIGGVVVVETVFTWGGIGSLFGSAIGASGLSGAGFTPGADYPLLQALLLLSALAVLLANLLADIAYAWLDPRIRYDAGNEG
jgi:peptide/nickel transport system permease protein